MAIYDVEITEHRKHNYTVEAENKTLAGIEAEEQHYSTMGELYDWEITGCDEMEPEDIESDYEFLKAMESLG